MQASAPKSTRAESEPQKFEVAVYDSVSAIEQEWIDLIQQVDHGVSIQGDPRMIRITCQLHPDLALRLVAIRDNNGLQCVAPFYVEYGRLPLKLSVWRWKGPQVRQLRLFGEQILFASNANQGECLRQVFGALKKLQREFDLIWIDGLRQEKEFIDAQIPFGEIATGAGLDLVIQRSDVNHRVRLPESTDLYVASLSSSTRQNLRRTTRRFLDEGDAEFTTLTSAEHVPQLLTWMSEVDANSWQGRTFDASNRMSEESCRQLQEIADRGWLRSYVLLKRGQPVAFEHGYLYRGTYFGLECAFDSRFSSAGPGSIVIFHAIQDLIAECGAEWVDFGVGEMAYKRSFGNESRPADTIYLLMPNRWQLLVRGQQMLDTVESGIRKTLVALKLDRIVRKWIKHQE